MKKFLLFLLMAMCLVGTGWSYSAHVSVHSSPHFSSPHVSSPHVSSPHISSPRVSSPSFHVSPVTPHTTFKSTSKSYNVTPVTPHVVPQSGNPRPYYSGTGTSYDSGNATMRTSSTVVVPVIVHDRQTTYVDNGVGTSTTVVTDSGDSSPSTAAQVFMWIVIGIIIVVLIVVVVLAIIS